MSTAEATEVVQEATQEEQTQGEATLQEEATLQGEATQEKEVLWVTPPGYEVLRVFAFVFDTPIRRAKLAKAIELNTLIAASWHETYSEDDGNVAEVGCPLWHLYEKAYYRPPIWRKDQYMKVQDFIEAYDTYVTKNYRRYHTPGSSYATNQQLLRNVAHACVKKILFTLESQI